MSILTRRKLIGASAFLLAAGAAYFSDDSAPQYRMRTNAQASSVVEPKKASAESYIAPTVESKVAPEAITFMPAENLESKIGEYRTNDNPAKKLDSLGGHYKFDEIIEIWNENQDILQGYKLDIDMVNGYKAAQIVPNTQADRAEIAKALDEIREATQGVIFTSPTIPAPTSK